MQYNSVPEMLNDMGENEMADSIRMHESCHEQIALQAKKIVELEEKLEMVTKQLNCLHSWKWSFESYEWVCNKCGLPRQYK